MSKEKIKALPEQETQLLINRIEETITTLELFEESKTESFRIVINSLKQKKIALQR